MLVIDTLEKEDKTIEYAAGGYLTKLPPSKGGTIDDDSRELLSPKQKKTSEKKLCFIAGRSSQERLTSDLSTDDTSTLTLKVEEKKNEEKRIKR